MSSCARGRNVREVHTGAAVDFMDTAEDRQIGNKEEIIEELDIGCFFVTMECRSPMKGMIFVGEVDDRVRTTLLYGRICCFRAIFCGSWRHCCMVVSMDERASKERQMSFVDCMGHAGRARVDDEEDGRVVEGSRMTSP